MPTKAKPATSAFAEVTVAQALAHPLRAAAFHALGERTLSPNDLARELGEPLGNVSYHVRELLKLGVIELVDTIPRRGAIEHYYRAKIRARIETEPTG